MNRSLLLRLGVAGFVVSAQVTLAGTPSASATFCGPANTRTVPVGTAAQLHRALDLARPGDVIQLRDGTYNGRFTLTRSGVAGAPVVICGQHAVLDGGHIAYGYTLHLQGVAYVEIEGLTIQHGQKAIMLDSSTRVTLRDLQIRRTGMEGVHFRHGSTDDILRDSTVTDTGLLRAEFGEGAYVGSAKNNWCRHGSCAPDLTARITITNNHFGPNVSAEAVDIKEGTTDGSVTKNSFDGTGMTAAYAWVDVKGNGWSITRNRGTASTRDGFSDNCVVPGWGNDNVFAHNYADVRAPGYGFRISKTTVGVQVQTNNVVVNAASGAANVAESPV